MNKSLHRLDLNLLIILQYLLEERSVSLVAARLAVTPSAVSKALTKLRTWFDDPLFIRSPQGLIPTPLMLRLEGVLPEFLHTAKSVAEIRDSDYPKGVQFRLLMEEPLNLIMLHDLAATILNHYPESAVSIRDWDYNSLSEVIAGEADIGLLGRESYPKSRESISAIPDIVNFDLLFTDRPLAFIRRGHPLLSEAWTISNLIKYPHISTEYANRIPWALDDLLHDLGYSRQIRLSYSSFEQSLQMAAHPGHELITCAPGYCRHYVTKFQLDLECRPLPFEESFYRQLDIPFLMLWHKRNAHNQKTRWLREQIRQSVTAFTGE